MRKCLLLATILLIIVLTFTACTSTEKPKDNIISGEDNIQNTEHGGGKLQL